MAFVVVAVEIKNELVKSKYSNENLPIKKFVILYQIIRMKIEIISRNINIPAAVVVVAGVVAVAVVVSQTRVVSSD